MLKQAIELRPVLTLVVVSLIRLTKVLAVYVIFRLSVSESVTLLLPFLPLSTELLRNIKVQISVFLKSLKVLIRNAKDTGNYLKYLRGRRIVLRLLVTKVAVNSEKIGYYLITSGYSKLFLALST